MSTNDQNSNPYAPSAPTGESEPIAGSAPFRRFWPLFALFATVYFVQGVVEPTAGLPSQPMQHQLEGWGRSQTEIGVFLFFIGIPWSLKPLLGLISDFLPIRGYRRYPYLALSTAATAGLFMWMSGLWHEASNQGLLAWLLLSTCAALSLTDVVVDALAVETGQPLGITGQMQAVQWGALSVAQMLSGTTAGLVAGYGLLRPAFIGCGILGLFSLAVCLSLVREPRGTRDPWANLRQAWQQLSSSRRIVVLISVALYLFLWNFNPFSSNVLQHYSTEVLHLSQQFYGVLGSLQGVTQLVACITYFFVCRRIPFPWLVHGSIACGVLSTLCYWLMYDAPTAVLASLVFGLTYQLATLIQLDLAARVVPTQSAATLFAVLMSISNTGITAGYGVGGWWYDGLTAAFGGNEHHAFDVLVAIGASFTAGCWLLVPVMRWAGAYKPQP